MSHHGRKPAHLEMHGGKSTRQRIWEKIRERKRFTARNIIHALPGNIHSDTTRTYLKSLEKAGFLSYEQPHYELIKDNGVEAPRVRKDGSTVTMGRAQENIWRTLRAIGRPVTTRELAAFATTEAIPVTHIATRDYVLNLNHAGYLNKYDGKRFQLKPAMNTGPRPPMIQRIKQVYDPNLGRVIWAEGANDED